jgi:hypothetical protein
VGCGRALRREWSYVERAESVGRLSGSADLGVDESVVEKGWTVDSAKEVLCS